MNKVLFDGLSTQSGSKALFHGGGEYAKHILKEALTHNYEFDIVFGNWLYTDDSIMELLKQYPNITVYSVNSKAEIYQLINRNQYKVFYSALPSKYFDYSGNAKLFGVIHGLRGAELPMDEYKYKYESNFHLRLLWWMISHSKTAQNYIKKKHIEEKRQLLQMKNTQYITVSNHTKNSMLYFYPELEPKDIQVFYSPFSVRQIKKEEQKDNYYLMVSANRFEKNVYRAVRAFDRLFSMGRLKGKKVIITGCGNQPFWKEVINKDCFELRPYVSSEELENLYAKAFCFVYPSLNEGFGYPPVKAMSYGTPVIASSATSIPEVCGDGACYFSPTNEDDLAIRILQLENDNEYRDKLVERGLKRVKELQELQQEEMVKELKLIFD